MSLLLFLCCSHPFLGLLSLPQTCCYYPTAQITTANISGLVKSIVSTSEASTSESGDGSNNSTNVRALAIGEVMRYRLKVAVPEGTNTNFVLTDTLPLGLTFLDGTLKLAYWADNNFTNGNGTASTELAGANAIPDADPPTFILPSTYYSYTAGSRLLTVNLQSPVNNDNDVSVEYVVLEFNVLVNNDVNNNNGSIQDNLFNVTVNSGAALASNHLYSKVLEPSILFGATAKVVTGSTTGYDAGDTVAYAITYTNTGTTDAFDVRILDILNSNYFTLQTPAAITAVPTGCSIVVTNNSKADAAPKLDQVDVTVSSVPVGCSVTIAYSAVLTTNIVPLTPYINTANLTYSSLPGDHGTGDVTLLSLIHI